MTARIVTFVLVFVVMGFTRGVVVMDVRTVSSNMAMVEGAHDFDRISSNGECPPHSREESHVPAVRSMRRPDWNCTKQVIDDTQLVGKK